MPFTQVRVYLFVIDPPSLVVRLAVSQSQRTRAKAMMASHGSWPDTSDGAIPLRVISSIPRWGEDARVQSRGYFGPVATGTAILSDVNA